MTLWCGDDVEYADDPRVEAVTEITKGLAVPGRQERVGVQEGIPGFLTTGASHTYELILALCRTNTCRVQLVP